MAANSDVVALPRMTSVDRLSKFPVVEQTVDLAGSLYGKVKDTNSLVNSVLSTAETTVRGAVDKTLPVANKLEGPIKVLDSLLCSSLDFVETNLPGVKLPPDEMYKSTKDYLFGFPVVKCACQLGEQGVRRAVDCACAVSDYSNQKLNNLRDSLATPEENKNFDARAVISMYLYTLFHILTVLTAWAGFGEGAEKRQNSVQNSSEKRKKKGRANGNTPHKERETLSEDGDMHNHNK